MMKTILKIGEREFGTEEIVAALHQHNLFLPVIRELVIDLAIEKIEAPDRPDNSEEVVSQRQLKIETFKRQTWGDRVESYFLQRKSQLDRVAYSLLRTKDAGMAQELYCRLVEKEATFEELARQYSQGPEAKTGGVVGPVELNTPHPTLAKMLSISEPGQLWPPTLLKDWFAIVRLEQFIPAQLDEKMRQQMLDEQFQLWLREQIQTASLQSREAKREDISPNGATVAPPPPKSRELVQSGNANQNPDSRALKFHPKNCVQ